MLFPLLLLGLGIFLLFTMFPLGIVVTPIAAIWLVIAFVVKVLGWSFRTVAGEDERRD